MTARNVISWTSTISSLVNSRRYVEAIGSFKSMLLAGKRPNYVTIVSVARAISLVDSEYLTREVHSFVIKTGLDLEASVVTAILGLYSVNAITDAVRLFYETPRKDLILWSAMVSACTKSMSFKQAIEKFREMQYFGMLPNNVTVVSVLPACAHLGALMSGKELHAFSIKQEFYSDTNLQNALVDFYSKCGNLYSSVFVFDRIPQKDLVSWNTITRACLENQNPRKVLHIFKRIGTSDVKPNEITILNVLLACPKTKEVHFGLGLHCFIVKSGLSSSISVGTTLLMMYSGFGEVDSCRHLFDILHPKDVVAWSAMVSVYAQAGKPKIALNTFKQMQSANEKPNEITFVGLLQACSLMGAEEHGKSIHGHVYRKEYSKHLFLNSALIDFYSKLGRLSQAKAVFDHMDSKDLICWSSMINGYGINGCGREALEAFYSMLQQGWKPNDVVFVSVLSACSHCGMLDEGWKWFSCMKEYGVTHNLAHYSCMVGLLSRQGSINEAMQMIKCMPMEPDATVWGALLAGCRAGNVETEVMELAAKELIRLDPNNMSYYVILSNLYADRGLWEDVERLRKLMMEKKLKKTSGYSLVEINY
ncbi:putative pentatricopeptide repeat-containing protein At1g69350, mitochondrial [Aristolochia californica]|uniref:putative pentatricopeptide repeat-containing protein At1g69350, mitochondrial n=1 Tax=Aristolochia californica TaxID=171875 RepID=UPI0035DB7884